jgi:hypothetical protein
VHGSPVDPAAAVRQQCAQPRRPFLRRNQAKSRSWPRAAILARLACPRLERTQLVGDGGELDTEQRADRMNV